MAHPLMSDSVWYNQQKYEASEALYQQNLAGTTSATTTTNQAKQTGASSIINELAQARQQIQKVLTSHNGGYCGGSGADSQVLQRVESLEKENKALKQVLDDMKAVIQRLEGRVSSLEGNKAPASAKPAPAPAKADDDDDDDDDVDLFGSDEEDDAEAEKLKEERVKLYYEKKAKKPAVIAKSNIILDVKPWDDETDMKELEKAVRSVTCDGLVWGASKLVPVGYGIKKLQITCVVEDEKVSTDFLDEEITAHEDYVQSVDIVAFNKI